MTYKYIVEANKWFDKINANLTISADNLEEAIAYLRGITKVPFRLDDDLTEED